MALMYQKLSSPFGQRLGLESSPPHIESVESKTMFPTAKTQSMSNTDPKAFANILPVKR